MLISTIIATTVLLVFFIRIGREYGYEALISRTKELNYDGVAKVYLATSLSDFGLRRGPSIWNYLNTGYLIYLNRGKIFIESPWWKTMTVIKVLDVKMIMTFDTPDNVLSIWHKRPGVIIDGRGYAMVGINQVECNELKVCLRNGTIEVANTTLAKFLEEFEEMHKLS